MLKNEIAWKDNIYNYHFLFMFLNFIAKLIHNQIWNIDKSLEFQCVFYFY